VELYLHSLQQGVDYLTAYLCRIFRICLVRGYLPKTWRQIGVMFIPKPKKAICAQIKECFHISLLFCMLKMVEKLLRHIRDGILDYIPYINTNLPTSQGSPLKQHRTM
jgi:hypothetical protein